MLTRSKLKEIYPSLQDKLKRHNDLRIKSLYRRENRKLRKANLKQDSKYGMSYFEEISLRSSETFRQWFKKLQCIIPGSFTRPNLKASTKLLFNGELISSQVFPSQKNLDVIMNTLRRDLINLLKKSDSSNAVTILLYKLNVLDNNIREICRFQHTWVNHTLSSIESLKVQEKYIIRLIEEIMDDIFDAYSKIKRKMHHMSFNERSINGIISVLGILKREVCNMIHTIIGAIERRHKPNFLENICNPPNTAPQNNLETVDQKNIKTQPEIKNEFLIDFQEKKSTQYLLHNNKSYPFLEKHSAPTFSFSSLQDIFCSWTENENALYFNKVLDDIPKDDCAMEGFPKQKYFSVKFPNDNKTNGQGDAGKNRSNKNMVTFSSWKNPENNTQEKSHRISKTLGPFLPYTQKNKSLISYSVDNKVKAKKETRGGSSIKSESFDMSLDDDTYTYLSDTKSKMSWPSATVVRDIKSDMHIDSKLERPGWSEVFYSTDESSKEGFSDSDSDDSYISCALEEFHLDPNFLEHIKEKYLIDNAIKRSLVEYSDRNNTDSFSCKSPKLSELYTGPRISKPSSSNIADEFHSVESIQPSIATFSEADSRNYICEGRSTTNNNIMYMSQSVHPSTASTQSVLPSKTKVNPSISTVNSYTTTVHPSTSISIEEENKINMCDGSGKKKQTNVAIGTESDMTFQPFQFKKRDRDKLDRKCCLPSKSGLIADSFNTLALSDDLDCNDARYTDSILSLVSVATETMICPEMERTPSMCTYKPLNQPPKVHYYLEPIRNLEDSQFSAICLALPPSDIRLVNRNVNNEVQLLAMEVE